MKRLAPILFAAALLAPVFASAQTVQCDLSGEQLTMSQSDCTSQGGTVQGSTSGNVQCDLGGEQLSMSQQACTSQGGTVQGGGLQGTTGANGATTNTTGAGGINTSYIQGYATSITSIINTILVPVLIAIAFIVFLWGVFKYFILGASSSEDRAEGAKFVLWGVVGFVIIFAVWGLVNILLQTLNLSAGGTHPLPPTL